MPPTSVEPADRAQLAGNCRASNLWIVTAACAVLIFIAFAIGTALTSTPITDEGLFADPAYTMRTKGYMGSPVLRDNAHLPRIEQRTYWIFPLDPLLQAAWYRVFGVGLFAMRSLSICFGLLGLGSVFVFIRRLTKDVRIASLSVTLVALDYFYIYGSALGRMDIICAALGYSGLAAYMELRERNLVLAVVASHSLIVASGTTHPNGLLYFLALLFLMFYFDRRRLKWRHVSVAALPYLIAAGVWGLYISQDLQAFLTQITANARDGDRFQGFRNPLLAFVREFTVRYARAYGFGPHSFGHTGPIYLKALALLAYFAGIIGALSIAELRRKAAVRILLALVGTFFVYLAIVDGQKAYYYLVHFIPMYASLLALFVFWLAEGKTNWKTVLLPLSFIVLVQLGGLAYRIRLNSYKNAYRPAVQYLQQNARNSQLINANAAFLLDLNFPDNLVDDTHLMRRADFFVIDGEVEDRLKNSMRRRPLVYRRITGLLTNCYQKVYDQNAISIYALRKFPGDVCEQAESGIR